MQVNKLIPKIKITQSATLLTVDQAPWHTYDLTNTFHSHHFFPSTSFHTFLIRTNSNNSVLSVNCFLNYFLKSWPSLSRPPPPPKKRVHSPTWHKKTPITNGRRQRVLLFASAPLPTLRHYTSSGPVRKVN